MLLKISLLCAVLLSCDAYKILGVYNVPAGSHYALASKLFKEIAKKGHEVTFITPRASKTPVKNLKEITVESLQNATKDLVLPSFYLENASPLEVGKYIMNIHYRLTEHLLKSEQVQKLLESDEKYHAVIVHQNLNDALQAIGHHFKAPVILFSAMPMYTCESFLLSYPITPAYVPNLLTEYTGRMSFWQRLRNTYYDVAIILYYLWNILPKYRELVFQQVPGSPDLYTFLNNASLALINSHVSTNEAIPLVPNAIEIGGYHIEEPKPLPEDLKKFLDDSKNGVVVFSMGSIAKSTDFPQEKVEALVKTFSKLKTNVLWKWEDDNLPGLPKNVRIMKWIPQSDVLAHPNVKALIFHGGLLSTMEIIYYGVPIIGIPINGDQKMNIALAVSREYGVLVPFQEITEEKLTWALNEVLDNPKYRNNAKRQSIILRDRPIKPLDSALYWIEYTIRHKGAPHLRYPGTDLWWYQRHLLDVIAFIAAATFVIFAILTMTFKIFCKPKISNKRKKE